MGHRFPQTAVTPGLLFAGLFLHPLRQSKGMTPQQRDELLLCHTEILALPRNPLRLWESFPSNSLFQGRQPSAGWGKWDQVPHKPSQNILAPSLAHSLWFQGTNAGAPGKSLSKYWWTIWAMWTSLILQSAFFKETSSSAWTGNKTFEKCNYLRYLDVTLS